MGEGCYVRLKIINPNDMLLKKGVAKGVQRGQEGRIGSPRRSERPWRGPKGSMGDVRGFPGGRQGVHGCQGGRVRVPGCQVGLQDLRGSTGRFDGSSDDVEGIYACI